MEVQQLIDSGVALSEKQLPVPPVIPEKPAKKSGKKPNKGKPSREPVAAAIDTQPLES
jgi:hypothetical protein